MCDAQLNEQCGVHMQEVKDKLGFKVVKDFSLVGASFMDVKRYVTTFYRIVSLTQPIK